MVKIYPCNFDDCVMVFNRREHFDRHVLSHTGERPFKCDFPGCVKDFTRKDNMKQHRRTHYGTKARKPPRRQQQQSSSDVSYSEEEEVEEQSGCVVTAWHNFTIPASQVPPLTLFEPVEPPVSFLGTDVHYLRKFKIIW